MKSQPSPPKLGLKVVRSFFKRLSITGERLDAWSKLLAFELDWWKDRRWLGARSFGQLAKQPIPDGFDPKERLVSETLLTTPS